MSDGSTDRDFTTTSDRWQRVQDVFAGAIECDGDARARMLDEQCGDDLELRREVESLLASHEQSGPFDRLAPAVAPAAAWVRTRVSGWEGRRVGQYMVVEVVDAGGMGIVYKAHDATARASRRVEVSPAAPQHTGRAEGTLSSGGSRGCHARSSEHLHHPGDWGDPTTDSCSSRCRCTTARPCGRDCGGAGYPSRKPSGSPSRLRAASAAPTRAASCTATSSRPTSWCFETVP